MTTVVTTCPAALVHASGNDIKNLIHAVTAHAAEIDPEGYEPPALTRIHVEVRGGELRLICSDRYSMGIVRQPVSSAPAGFVASFAVPAEDVECALASLGDAPASLIVEENALRISTGNGNHHFPGVPSGVPWRKALERILAPQPTPTGHIALDPKLVARLQDAKPLAPEQPLLVRLSGECGAVVATLGTTFLGMVMPINLRDAVRLGSVPDRPLDGWFDLLDETAVAVA